MSKRPNETAKTQRPKSAKFEEIWQEEEIAQFSVSP